MSSTDLDAQLDEIPVSVLRSDGQTVTLGGCKLSTETKQALTKLIENTAKAYGGCTNCYGKGYATAVTWAAAKGKKWPTSGPMQFCDCERGTQLQTLIADREREAEIRAEYEGKRKMLRRMVIKGYVDDLTAIAHLTIIDAEKTKSLAELRKEGDK